MDELLIEEKKYISSKQAAKITGYAKDYIGQLCREGRVPARLVGRSWYVLETAIQDHRFGDTDDGTEKNKKEAVRSSLLSTAIPSTWETPRYEASPVVPLPSLDSFERAEPNAQADMQENIESVQGLQDSWQAWFDHIEPAVAESEPSLPEPEEDRGIDIPIHSIYKPVTAEALPPLADATEAQREEEQPWYQEKRTDKRKRLVPLSIQLAGMFFAFVIAVIAVVGTGYFDESIISNSQARIIAGVAVYNK